MLRIKEETGPLVLRRISPVYPAITGEGGFRLCHNRRFPAVGGWWSWRYRNRVQNAFFISFYKFSRVYHCAFLPLVPLPGGPLGNIPFYSFVHHQRLLYRKTVQRLPLRFMPVHPIAEFRGTGAALSRLFHRIVFRLFQPDCSGGQLAIPHLPDNESSHLSKPFNPLDC